MSATGLMRKDCYLPTGLKFNDSTCSHVLNDRYSITALFPLSLTGRNYPGITSIMMFYTQVRLHGEEGGIYLNDRRVELVTHIPRLAEIQIEKKRSRYT